MGMMRSRLRTGWFLAIIGALALMGACSLNTQPIPPGETDGTSGGSDASTGTPTNAANADSGGSDGAGKGDDAGGTFTSDDGGDAGDASLEDASDSGDL